MEENIEAEWYESWKWKQSFEKSTYAHSHTKTLYDPKSNTYIYRKELNVWYWLTSLAVL